MGLVTCRSLLLETAGAARIHQVDAAPGWGNEGLLLLQGAEAAAQTTPVGSLAATPQLLLDLMPSASPELTFDLLQPLLLSNAMVNSLLM